MLSPEEVVAEYGASLIEPDEARRLVILAGVWTDDCEVILPEVRLVGREAINAHITTIRRAVGRATPILSGPVDAHNGFLRFEWRMIDAAGEVVAAGVNIGEQAADGRLRRVVLFRGVRPGVYL
ncbi:MAG TPA: hypothetical protein VFV93_06040 [Thermomicrobiales bacterium]|nr:hypothetical protein [Thermomicrobiales bacterium]